MSDTAFWSCCETYWLMLLLCDHGSEEIYGCLNELVSIAYWFEWDWWLEFGRSEISRELCSWGRNGLYGTGPCWVGIRLIGSETWYAHLLPIVWRWSPSAVSLGLQGSCVCHRYSAFFLPNSYPPYPSVSPFLNLWIHLILRSSLLLEQLYLGSLCGEEDPVSYKSN